MDTSKLKQYAQYARRSLMTQVSSKLQIVLAEASPARRESAAVVKALESAIRDQGEDQIIEQVAYTWFNRFCALRFMDVNRFTRIGVISPAEGQFQPEILAEAKMGHIDEKMVDEKIRQKVFALLDGKSPSQDPQGEAYRLLVVAACNDYHRVMPYLFERIADYTELLMPDELLSGNSILAYTREAMTPDACKDVEVIGWLYQFYISEKKDMVMARKSAVPTEDIPAVTQLFTPHWIVRYLVENSLGRLWMLNHPNSKLCEHMPYYIEGEAETDFLKVSKPEDIRLIDPAVGSGHMLTYAFDLLYQIYEESGTEPNEIPEKILTHNLFGIEIDERAGELAAFALTMKARAKQRRFFSKAIKPNILVLQNILFSDQELNEYMNSVGRDLFTQNLREALTQFEQAKNFGSLIQPCLSEQEILNIRREIEAKDLGGQLFLRETHLKVLRVLEQSETLTQRYHVVVANPPYMGSGAMNSRLKSFVESELKSGKADTYSAFMLRNLSLAVRSGYVAMITIPNWMFLKTFEPLRDHLLQHSFISSLVHCGRGVWGSDFGSCAFVYQFTTASDSAGVYKRLFKKQGEVQSNEELEANFYDVGNFPEYRAKNSTFRKIIGSPIAYWIKGLENFSQRKIGDLFVSGGRNKTHDNEKYLRFFWEVATDQKRWVVYANGGDFRKHYGNELNVVDWSDSARSFYESNGGLCNREYWGKEGITWSLVTAAISSFRIKRSFAQYSSGSPTIFSKDFQCDLVALSFLNSVVSIYYLRALNPTVNTTVNDIFTLPFLLLSNDKCSAVESRSAECMALAHADWDNFETSWDFRDQPLLRPGLKGATLEASWRNWEAQSTAAIRRMQELETENNRLFIAAYGLEGELQPEVPEAQITLARAEARRDMAAFLSYAVGCMMGRYSIDHPGLILANPGDTLREFLEKVGKPLDELSFAPDEDGVIPILDGDWFEDDIVARTRDFLRATFGEATLRENLRFIEDSLGKDLRKYFLTDFYKDHLQTYKKRPIYWLFSSPKGTFNALIYLHRYRPDTVSVVLNRYLRDFRSKLSAQKNHLEAISISSNASQVEKTKALREIEKLSKMMIELEEYERDVLYPLATEQVILDLDDGVKLNYPKLGKALKKIAGLETTDD